MRTLFFISFILFGKLHAQTFQLDNWNQQNGAIGNNTIQAIEIDHLGNTWVGTDFGLHIFNGQEWEAVTTANSSISSNQIRSITFDNLNQPWVGTFNHGITYFNGEEWINFSTENSPLPDNFIKDLKFDLNNNLWIASTGGLAKKGK
jgi:ligand-binding sensor domain-containing protein